MPDPTDRRTELLDWRFKAIPAQAHGLTVAQWLRNRPHRTELPTPLLTLDAEALDHNLHAMAAWCRSAGVHLAPHGKPTMAPALWQRQLAAGAWGITVANPAQARVAHAWAVPVIMVANEIVAPTALRELAGWVADGTRVVCFADSTDAVSAMDTALRNAAAPIEVCVELGVPGGRCGARDTDTALRVAAAIATSPRLKLAGVAGYEGSVAHGVTDADLARIDAFLDRMAALAGRIEPEVNGPLVTAGGSQYFDQVADRLAPLGERGWDVVLRAGSYLTHDDGRYAAVTPAARGRSGPRLRSALRAWATVLSVPEPGRAVLDAGRRDLPFDQGLPIPLDLPGAEVVELNDQHAHLVGAVAGLRVGDVVRLGVSHPCTTMDKWSLIPLLDGEERVADLVRTYF